METTSGVEAAVEAPVIPLEKKKKMKVMVAIDESDGSFYALEWVINNILTPRGVTPHTAADLDSADMLTLVHVQPPFQHALYPAGPIFTGGVVIYPTSTVTESIRKAQEQNSAALLTRALAICKERMVKAETLILDGDPKEMICQATEKTHVDLLVISSRGLGMIKRAFLGSVSDYCAQHAKSPILIVKPPMQSTK